MTVERISFGEFTYDAAERQLRRGSDRIEVSGRYLDALGLLLNERGRLVTKDRFMDEVWQGVPVTEEALTQCIRTLRRELGDDAARPRFIETVPKHGYRFIADASQAHTTPPPTIQADGTTILRTAAVGAVGGALAGAGGGLLYGLLAASPSGIGALSTLSVMLAISMLLGLTAGFGVAGGIAAARLVAWDRWQVTTAGGMLGGLLVGGIAKLVGLDGFALLFGRAPDGMTGPAEGALLGAAIGLGVWIARSRQMSFGRSAATGLLAGAVAGLLIPMLGGHLLGGSLNLLTQQFPDSRFRLDTIGGLFGETGFGPISEVMTASIEGALFGLGVAGALAFVLREPRDVGPRMR